MDIGPVQLLRLSPSDAGGDRETCPPKRRSSLSLDQWIWIGHGDDYTADTRAKDFRNAWRSTFVEVTTRLKRDIERRASGKTVGLPKRENFRMRKTRTEMKPLPDDSALCDNHSAHHRIRADRSPALRRKAKG
jgi:hypothetical protein